MPISSNYHINLSPLSQQEIGIIQPAPKKEEFNWINFVRTLVTVAEVGLSLIPGVGTLAATGIAVTAAAINTALDASQGSLSGANLAITWGAALIPAGSQLFSNARGISKINKTIKSTQEALDKAIEVAGDTNKIFGTPAKVLERGYKSQIQDLLKIKRQVGLFTNIKGDLPKIVKKTQEEALHKLGQTAAKETAFIREIDEFLKKAYPGRDIDTSKFLDWYNMAASKAQKEAIGKAFTEATGTTFEKLESSWEWLQRLSKELDPEAISKGYEELQELVLGVLNPRRKIAGGEALAGGQDDIRKWKLSIEFEGVERELRLVFGNQAIDELIFSVRNAPKAQQQSRMMAWIRENLDREAAEALILKVDNAAGRSAIRQGMPKGFIDSHVYAAKRPFSSYFYDKWVQKLQLIDPNDIGRAPAEFVYKKLRRKMEEFITAKKRASSWAKIKDTYKKLDALKETFQKTGGILVNSKRIIGYKIIRRIGHKTLIMISFNPELAMLGGTGAVHRIWNGKMTKNYFGKKPVFVEATDLQLEELRAGGFAYYLNTWAFNHGGSAVGGKYFGMGSMLSGVIPLLPWINTTALRSWLSITSNWVENTADMAAGEYKVKWVDKFVRSLRRTTISRGGRLIAQGIIRPLIGGKTGFLVGRELQRILGITTTSINDAMELKNGNFSENFNRKFKSKLLPKYNQAFTSYTNRYGRKKGAYTAQVRAAKRKLGFLRRPVSALTPNSVLNPRNFTRFDT